MSEESSNGARKKDLETPSSHNLERNEQSKK